MEIKNIDRNTAIMLGDEVMEAVNKIAAKYGLEAKRGSGRYDDNEYKLNSVTLFVSSGSGTGMIPSKENKLAVMWNIKRGQYGMDNINVGDELTNYKGEKIKLIGWDSKKRKYPVIYQNLTKGGQFKSDPMNFKAQVQG